MPSFYDKLPDLNLLRRAWHIARKDSKGGFMFDSHRFADFAIELDDQLKSISSSLRNRSYYPKPVRTIDVPKSSLSVRPGTVLEIEDQVVLFAIACLIAPPLDRRLPTSVYSWRVKPDARIDELFQDVEFLRHPFLRRQTISQHVDIVEPWYGAWPKFMEEMQAAYTREGYRFLVLADIVSYFENIDLEVLRLLLLRYLPNQGELVQFLIDLMEYWAWRSIHGSTAPRGIPQGNGVSSFLGNIYLLPVDLRLRSLSRRMNIRVFRYIDDIKIFAQDMKTARHAFFELNSELRRLRLNIQGSKTVILQDDEIAEELFDDRISAVNNVIERTQRRAHISVVVERGLVGILKVELRQVKGRARIVQGKELRLFRRLLTAFGLLQNSAMVRVVLDQLGRNPDQRLLNSAIKYLRVQDRNLRSISERLVALLTSESGLFFYQAAYFLMMLKYARNIPSEGVSEAFRKASDYRNHWYVRQHAALLIGLVSLSPGQLRRIERYYSKEQNADVKRAWAQALAQLPKERLVRIVRELILATEPKLQRLGRYYLRLLDDNNVGFSQVESLFRNRLPEDSLVERFYELELLARSNHARVKNRLLTHLKRERRRLHRPLLRERFGELIEAIEAQPRVSQQ